MDRITATKVFVTIVEQGSLIAAANKLDMSRAMITRYLTEMESWAGVRLLHRTTRKISLTSAGESTYERSRQLLDLAENLPLQQDGDGTQLSGQLRITCSQSLAADALTRATVEFLQRHQNIAIELLVDNKKLDLIDERVDLAIRISNQLPDNVIARRLAQCDSILCASPAYLAGRKMPQHPDDLNHYNCLTYPFLNKNRWSFTDEDKHFDVEVDGTLSANESTVLLEATLLGAGISLQPLNSVSPYLKSGRLVALLPQYQPQTLGIHAIYNSRKNMAPALRAFIDYLIYWFEYSPHWQALTSYQ